MLKLLQKKLKLLQRKKKVEDKICPAESGNKCKAWEFGSGEVGDNIMDQFHKEYTKRFSDDPEISKKIFKKLLQKKWYDANIYVEQNQSIFKNPELFNNYSDEEQKLLEIFRGGEAMRMFYQTVELIKKKNGKKPQDVPNEMHGFWTAQQQKDLFAKVLSDSEMHKLDEPEMNKLLNGLSVDDIIIIKNMSPTDSKILKNEIDAAVPAAREEAAAGGRKRRKKKSIRRKTKHKRKRKRKSKTKRKRKSKTKRKRKSKKTQKKTKQTKKLLKF